MYSALLEALDVFGEFNPAEFGLVSGDEEDEDEEREEVRRTVLTKHVPCCHTFPVEWYMCVWVGIVFIFLRIRTLVSNKLSEAQSKHDIHVMNMQRL